MTSAAEIAAVLAAYRKGNDQRVVARLTRVPVNAVGKIIGEHMPAQERLRIAGQNRAQAARERARREYPRGPNHGNYGRPAPLPTPAQIAAETREILAARLAGMRGAHA